MFIILDVERKNNKSLSDKIYSIFKPYTVEKKVIKSSDISILQIKYILNRGEINLKKLFRKIFGVDNEILCDKNISLKGTPFKRFENKEFNRIMMKNFILSLLNTQELTGKNTRISLYDPNAEFSPLAKELLNYTSNLIVVSNMPKFYENESEKLLKEIGVGFIVSNSVEKLIPCDILICPEKIKIPLPTMSSSLIFTIQKPLVRIAGTIITDYPPNLPLKYHEIKPESIDDLYFLSALYTLCGQKSLKELIPDYCMTDNNRISLEQLSKRINAQLMFEIV